MTQLPDSNYHAPEGPQKYIGKAVKRVEDPRFITGQGHYTDDINVHGQLHAAMLRSPYSHAKISKIDASAALALEGVHAVLTGQDLADAKVGSIPTGWLLPDLKIPPHPAIAHGEVHYVGDIVAVVIAETRALAEDAAALIDVDLEPLGGVSLGSQALAEGAPEVHPEAPGNVAFKWEIGDEAATDELFRQADHVVKLKLRNHRLVPNAIEPRASLAQYQRSSEEFTLHTTSQNPHIHRLLLAAFVLGIPEHKLRVISPDVGGGFGSKIFQYPEEVIVLFAAKKLNRPIKWAARRSESFVSDMQGRDHESEAQLALTKDGKMLALKVDTIANMGAYLTTFAPAVPTYLYGTLLNGVYKFGAVHAKVTGVFTNTVPVDAYRGAGRPEATYLIERIVSKAASELGIDAAELRRKNFIQPDEFPYQTPVALVYDSGDYEPALDKALKMVGYQELLKEQAEGRKNGRYIGIGFSTYLEACGLAPSALVGQLGAQAGQWESAVVRVMPTGKIEVLTGSHSHGQGHETTFAQIAAEEFGIPMEDVVIVHGDTGKMPFGWGTYGIALGGGGRQRPQDGAGPHQGQGHPDRRAPAGSRAGRHRGGRRTLQGQRRAGRRQVVFRRGADGPPGPQPPRGHGAGPGSPVHVRPQELRLPVRHPHRGGGTRRRHRPRSAHQVCLRGRLRPDHQPADRGRSGSRRHCPGIRPGHFGRDRLRRRRHHADRLVYGIQHAPR